MGFWPFGGKRHRLQETGTHAREKSQQSTPPSTMATMEKVGSATSGVGSKPDSGAASRRMSKTRASLSTLGANQKQPQTRSVTSPVTSSGRHSALGYTSESRDVYQHTPLSQSSLGPENMHVGERPPTLYAKRSDHDSSNLPRRKSSKRKAEDYAREREVRAMTSSPIPIPTSKRPATFYGSGNMMQRDSKDVPGDLNRKLKRPSSRVSLPIPQTLPSADDTEHRSSFKIGTFAALSPRPTLKYDANPRNAAGKQKLRSKPSIKQAIAEEEDLNEKRINELADDLDAGGIRELMEKDRRKREKKKESERAKLQRKLQRRADREKEEEARRARTEDYVRDSARNSERGQSVGLESPTKAEDGSRLEPGSPAGRKRPISDPFRDPTSSTQKAPAAIRNPFEDEAEVDVMQDQPSVEDEDEPEIPVRSPLRKAPAGSERAGVKPIVTTLSPPVSPVQHATDGQSMSQASFLNREETSDVPASASVDRRASDQSSQRLGSWTNFFRRGTRRKPSSSFRGRDTPSEFSNTSRESFARKQQQQQQPPPPPPPPSAGVPRNYGRPESYTPQRTTSKFREDLPEGLISPPDSRVQSPEAAEPPSKTQTLATDLDAPLGEPGPAEFVTTPISPVQEHEHRTSPQQPVNVDAASGFGGDAPVSQSLASVDSEGSWLSGRPIKRQSVPGSHQLRKSESSLHRHAPGTYENDDEGLADDEFMSRLSPAPGDQRPAVGTEERKPSSTVINLQDDAQTMPLTETSKASHRSEETYRGSVGRKPTLVRQPARTKSKEGLLSEYLPDEPKSSAPDTETEGEGDFDLESPGAELSQVQLMRARSVDYKGHARKISAGSAKLLDIRRGSIQSETGKGPPTPRSSTQATGETTQTEVTKATE